MIKGPYSPSPLFYQHRPSDSPLKHQQTQYYTPNPTTIESYQQPFSTLSYPMHNSALSAAPRTLPPHLAVSKSSEPHSPATIATTISCHSTPSPSPSRVVIMPEQGPVANDFTLFDEALLAASQELSQKAREGSNLSLATNDSSHFQPSGNYPILAGSYAHNNNNHPHHHSGFDIYNSQGTTTNNNSHQYTNLPLDTNNSMYDSTNNSRLMQNSYTDYSKVPLGLPMSQQHNQAPYDEEEVPALSPNNAQYSRSSRPSVSSSVGTFKSPATPDRIPEHDDKLNYTMQLHNPVPKLGRTYSDAVQDELYNPGLIQPSDYSNKARKVNHQHSASSSSLKSVMSNLPDLFQEAQQQHQQNLSPQQLQSRDRSPFRANSPFHPVNSRFTFEPSNQGTKYPVSDASAQSSTKTISPRDAMLEYTEPEGEGVRINLFGPTRENSQEESLNMQQSSQGSSLEDYQSIDTSRRPSVASASSHVDMPLQYNTYSQPMYTNTYYNAVPDTGMNHIPSYEDNRSNFSEESSSTFHHQIEKPADTKANTGTYTCTYSGCGQRFTTSAKLQKHRRESHRRSPATSNSVSTAAAIASRNAQPGPHRCMRPNANGKPCNSIFSRPYDLTRHEDTIHNTRKEKVRCEICNDEKTFSRSDALVRHRRVKHGIH